MPRASFTLRKPGPDNGSYVGYPPSYDGSASVSAFYPPGFPIRTSDDTYLKADDLLLAPISNVRIPGGNEYSSASFFTVDAIEYTQVRIQWGVPFATTLTSIPQATGVVIAYSPQGCPATIAEGYVLVEGSNGNQYLHEVSTGKWAYYTLFVKYQSNAGDLYYEPAASLSVLVPKNYGSTDLLYKRIPNYYRLEDGYLDEGTGGPLYRYLSLIGWEIDLFRTLLDYLISCKDPQEANSQELDLLAQDLGLDLLSEELGAARLRAYLNDVGTLRRSLGTPSSLLSALSAITGSVVTQNGTDIRVQPQRINFIADPMITSVGSNIDGGLPNDTFTPPSIDGGLLLPDVTGATYSGTTGTITFASAHGITAGDVALGVRASLTGFTASGWNGNFAVSGVPTTNTLTVVIPTNPGTISVLGSVSAFATSGAFGSPIDGGFFLPSITSAIASGNTGVVSFSAPHGLTTGTRVTFSGFAPGAWNGTRAVTVLDGTTISTVVTTTSATLVGTAVLYIAPNTGSTWASSYDPGSVTGYIVQTASASVPVAAGDTFYFSVHNDGQNNVTKVGLDYASGISQVVISEVTTFQVSGGRRYWKLTVPSNYTGPSLASLRIHYTPPNNAIDQTPQGVLGGYLLLEKNFIGSYFDGNTKRGGWIVGFPYASSISDYRWLSTANSSFSVYSENFQRTKYVVRKLLPTLIPVNQLITTGTVYSNQQAGSTLYSLVYNYIPGYST